MFVFTFIILKRHNNYDGDYDDADNTTRSPQFPTFFLSVDDIY